LEFTAVAYEHLIDKETLNFCMKVTQFSHLHSSGIRHVVRQKSTATYAYHMNATLQCKYSTNDKRDRLYQ